MGLDEKEPLYFLFSSDALQYRRHTSPPPRPVRFDAHAGMIISSVDDIDSLFTYTTTGWYCVYAALAVACVVSFVAIVRYTSAEMEAAVRTAPRRGVGVDGGGVDGEDDFGELPPDATMFGTFTSRQGGDGGDGGDAGEAMGTFDEIVVAREPLLGGESRRKDGPAGGPVPAVNGLANSVVHV